MEITLLVKIIAGLIVVLAILIFVFVLSSDTNKDQIHKSKNVAGDEKQKTDMVTLRAILRNNRTTTDELEETLRLILKHHGRIHKKLGSRSHPDFDSYMEILFMICRHPNTTKDIILDFDKELVRKNPTYKHEINEAITKGLDSR